MVKDTFRLVEGLRRRVSLIIGRGLVKAVDDTSSRQRLQVALLNDELRDEVERFQSYGLTSVPQTGAEAIVVFAGGDRGNGVVIACDDRRYRVNGLKKGEVCLYTDEGDQIMLGRGNLMALKTKAFALECEVAAIRTKSFAVTCDTVSIKNQTGELIGIISELAEALMAATAGRDPLICPALPVIKTRIDTFMKA